jgi:hypothetical protein
MNKLVAFVPSAESAAHGTVMPVPGPFDRVPAIPPVSVQLDKAVWHRLMAMEIVERILFHHVGHLLVDHFLRLACQTMSITRNSIRIWYERYVDYDNGDDELFPLMVRQACLSRTLFFMKQIHTHYFEKMSFRGFAVASMCMPNTTCFMAMCNHQRFQGFHYDDSQSGEESSITEEDEEYEEDPDSEGDLPPFMFVARGRSVKCQRLLGGYRMHILARTINHPGDTYCIDNQRWGAYSTGPVVANTLLMKHTADNFKDIHVLTTDAYTTPNIFIHLRTHTHRMLWSPPEYVQQSVAWKAFKRLCVDTLGPRVGLYIPTKSEDDTFTGTWPDINYASV